MKKLIITLALLASIPTFAEVNYDIDRASKTVTMNTQRSTAEPSKTDSETGYTMEVNGKSFPIYKTKSGKYYIIKVSKKGSTYRQYLKDLKF